VTEQEYLQILSADSSHIPAYRSLQAIYRSEGRYQELVDLLVSEAKVTEQPRTIYELLREAARVCLHQLGAVEKAVQLLVQAIEIDAERPEGYRLLTEAFSTAGDWKQADTALAQIEGRTTEPQARVELALERGRILRNMLKDDEAALAVYQGALAAVEKSAALSEAIATVHTHAGRWEQAAAAESDRILVLDNPADAVEARFALGNLLWGRLNRADEAREQFAKLLETDPQHLAALEVLSEIDCHLKNWPDLAANIERQVALMSDAQDKATCLIRLALLQQDKQADTGAALNTLKQAAEFAPADDSIIVLMTDMARTAGAWDRVVELLGRKANLLRDEESKIDLQREIGSILLEHLERYQEAETYLRRVFAQRPNDVDVLRDLGHVYEEGRRFEELAQNISQRVALLGPGRESMLLYQWLGEICEDKLTQPDRAIEAYKQALYLDPSNTAALQKLSDLMTTTERWSELIEILEQDAEKTLDPKQTVATYIRIGEIYEEKLEDQSKAIESFSKVLAFAPSYLPALRALQRLYLATDNWADLIKVYKKESKLATDPQQLIALAMKRAEVFEDKLGNLNEAALGYAEALFYAPDHPGAIASYERLLKAIEDVKKLEEFYRKEIEVLEDPQLQADFHGRLGTLLEKIEGREDESVLAYTNMMQLRADSTIAFAGLERQLSKLGRYQELEQLYDRLSVEDAGPKLLLKKAKLYENAFDDPQRALEAYAQVLQEDPGNIEAGTAIERLALILNDFKSLAVSLNTRIEKTKSKQLISVLQTRLGDVNRHFLRDSGGTDQAYRDAIATDPAAELPVKLLIDHLDETLRSDDLAALYQRRVQIATDSKIKFKQLCRLAEILESTGTEPAKILEVYDAALKLVPDDSDIIERTAALYRRVADWARLATTLTRLIELVTEPRRRLEFALDLARTWDEQLGDSERAIVIYRQARQADPESRTAIRELQRLYLTGGKWDELVELYQLETERYQAKDQVLGFWLEIGRIRLMEQQRVEDAMAAYESALQVDPQDLRALSAITGLYEQTQQWQKFIEASEQELGLTEAAERKMANLRRQAEVLETHLSDNVAAIDRYSRAFKVDSMDAEVIEHLVRLSQEVSAAADAIKWLKELLPARPEPPQQAETHWRVATIAREQLQDMAQVEQALLDSRAADGNYVPTLRDLAELYFESSRWDDSIEVSERLVKLEETEEKRAEHLVRIGRALQDGKEDPESARNYYEKALGQVPTYVPALSAIGSLYEEAEQWDKAKDTYDKFAAILVREDPAKTLPLRLKLGWLYKEKLNDQQNAILEYSRAASLDDTNMEANEALGELYSASDHHRNEMVRQNIKLIRLKVEEPLFYRRLSEMYDAQKAYDKVLMFYRAIDLITEPSDLERIFLDGNLATMRKEPKGAVDEDNRESLAANNRKRNAAGKILMLIDCFCEKIYRPDFTKFKLNEKKDRITRKMANGNAVRARLDGYASVLGCDEYMLYLSKELNGYAVLNTETPSIVIGHGYYNALEDKQQRYLLGRVLEIAFGGQILMEKLHITEIDALIRAVVAVITGDDSIANVERAQTLTGEVKRIIPRKIRKPLEDACQEFIRTKHEYNPEELSVGMSRTADRVGMLLAGDIMPALKSMQTAQGEVGKYNLQNKPDMVQYLQNNEDALSLWVYSLSDPYFNLRRRLKMSLA
jgi:tetratricopeptide (TPR) repeat protein